MYGERNIKPANFVIQNVIKENLAPQLVQAGQISREYGVKHPNICEEELTADSE
jgi:hypothetical protein